MSLSPKAAPGTVSLTRRGLVTSLVAVMIFGCLGGVVIHQAADRERWTGSVEAASDGSAPSAQAAADAAPEDLAAQPAEAPQVAAAQRPLRLRAVSVMTPEDPFQPTAADPLAFAAPSGAGMPSRMWSLPPAGSAAGSASAGPRPGTPVGVVRRARAAPMPADLIVSGVIHGEPPLVVVNYSGQSFFLKVGDQVAEAWRLAEIKERSAVFELGGQRVEIPIKGGSPE